MGEWFALVATWSFVGIAAGQPLFINKTDKEILDHILHPSRYDRRMRPGDTPIVNITVLLLSLLSPGESSLTYEVELLLHQKWVDSRLMFDDEGTHKYLNALKHFNYTWLPDIYFIKHGEAKQPIAAPYIALRIYSNGTVYYTIRRKMILNCQGNLKIFPFDNPKCSFAMESISYEVSQMELRWSVEEPPIQQASTLQYHNAYMVKNYSGVCEPHHTWRGNFSCLHVLLVFTRDKSFYFSTVFVPGMVLVTSSFISFWLDITVVPARVMIGVTTMLNFCTTTNRFRSNLPVVSDLKAMNLWDGVCLFFIYVSMLEYVVVNYLHRKLPRSRPPSALPVPTEIVRTPSGQSHVRQRRGSDGTKTNSESPGSETNDLTPQETPVMTDFSQHQAPQPQPPGPQPTLALWDWLKRTQILIIESSSKQRIPASIDNVSKIVFPVLFGIFVFGFFLAHSIILPSQSENWNLIINEDY
ncbi:glutamate-gated chloride channel-like isoform X1 [Centruroides sculpturatus]|uniref:glutamate-gated chloride channel-like isoform X1 n=2 Tax=Centruroides sculpturatus TaxID=218467 RepID=UPI000C6E99A4|nr:glutamate-gated chloride channel-like isoform X1 [Centruroides sculpturatus]XP_023222759.1 glutamate-gated chloride channel-like isoform X1 [Centruroides sculpturatus]